MTAPTDSRAEARALIVEARNIDAGYFTASADGRTTSIRTRLLAALEAALDELERKDASGAQALAALRRLHMYSDCNCGGGYVCDERRAIDALEEAITCKALE